MSKSKTIILFVIVLQVTMTWAQAFNKKPFAQVKNKYTIINQVIVDKPVSPMLYGNFIELGFGRSENAWSEMLYNRSFEEEKPYICDWVSFDFPSKEQENWWHSGYETPEWYLQKSGSDKSSSFSKGKGYWPACHSETLVSLSNKSDSLPVYLAQDGLYVRKGISYHFSGYFNDGSGFSGDKISKKPVEITIGLYPEKNFSKPIVEKTVIVNTVQFNEFKIDLPATDFEGRATFSIKVPAKKKVGLDFLSLKPCDNVKGWRKDVVEMMKNVVPATIIRFPGGCFSSNYNWRDGVGENIFRPIVYNASWWGTQVNNDIGTIEFVDLCREIKAQPQMCVPLMFKSVENAVDWLRFCNEPHNAFRAKCGRPEPLNVKYWEMENEMYRRYDAITYAEKCIEFSKAMKAVDPTIKIIMGDYFVYNSKLKEMLELAGPYVDIINNRGGSMKEVASDMAIVKEYNKTHQRNIQMCHSEFRAPTARNIGGVDGQNRLQTEEKGSLQNLSVRWAYGMSVIDQLIQYQNLGGDYAFTNFTCYTDSWGESLININKDAPTLSAAGRAYELLYKLNISLPVKIESVTTDRNLVLQAAWNANKTQFTILVENFDNKEHACTFDISDLKTKFETRQILYRIGAESSKAFNSPANQNAIKSTKEEVKFSSTKFDLNVLPNGVCAVVFDIKKK
jgi:alpha-L-arabinofuranosidase